MTEERTTPLRERMIEDMRIRGLGEKSQKAHIRGVKEFARFLHRSPDTATPDDLRAYQLHMTNAEVAVPTFNARIAALRVSGTFAAPLARRFPSTLRRDLRARGDEAVHAVPQQAVEAAGGAERRGG